MRSFCFNRIVGILLICSLIIACLVSCDNAGISAADVMGIIESSQSEKLPSTRHIYRYSASVYSMEHMSDELVYSLYYDGRKSDMWELSLLSDYIVRLGDDDRQFEVHIFKVRYRSDVDTIEKFLLRRLDRIRSRALYIYDPEGYEKYAFSAGVYTIENFVLLLCFPDNESALKAIERHI